MENNKKIGILMTYNCGHLLENAYKNLPKDVFDLIFIVDDGSKDDVKDVADKLGIMFFTHPHMGYGGNLRYGLQKGLELGGEYIVELHGDGQFDPSVSLQALEKMKNYDLDFVIGSRFTDLKQPLKDGMPWPRYYANIGLSFIERLVLRIPWTEYHAGFRVYRRRFIDRINLSLGANDYLYSFQIITLAAYIKAKCGEVSVRANYKGEHTSVGYKKAIINSFQELGILILFILEKIKIKTSLRKLIK